MKKRIASLGVLTALAFGLSYLEFLIPFEAIGIPGIKLGLANLAVMVALYRFGTPDAAAVSGIRILLSWLIFGSLNGFLYSLAGGALSLLLMVLLKKTGFFGEIGISICGGVSHNIGQLMVAALLTDTGAMLYYLPVLLLMGALTGALNGVLLRAILKRMRQLS